MNLFLYSVKLVVFNNQHSIIHTLLWFDLPYNLRLKWDWYFSYRAALFQVQFPRFDVQLIYSRYQAKDTSLKRLLNNQLINKKGKLTHYQNQIKLAQLHWNSLFPISDDPLYISSLSLIDSVQLEIDNLMSQINSL